MLHSQCARGLTDLERRLIGGQINYGAIDERRAEAERLAGSARSAAREARPAALRRGDLGERLHARGRHQSGAGLRPLGRHPAPRSGLHRPAQLRLWDGIGLVPVTIGFYAIPETIELAVLGTSIAQEKVEELGDVMQGVKDTFIHWWLVIRWPA